MKKPVNSAKSNPLTGPHADPHTDRESAKYDNPIASREHLLDLIKQSDAPMRIEEVAKKLGIKKESDQREALQRRIGAMIRDGQLIENRTQQLVPVDADALIAGKLTAHPDGFGFLITDDDDDIFLNAREMRMALHGDKVVVCVTGTNKRGKREGRIVKVLERANNSIVGRLFLEKGMSFVSPDNKRISQDITIPPDDRAGATHGDMVVAAIVEQPTRKHPPTGKIVEVLGQHLEAGMEIDVALRSRDIPFNWPNDVEDQAAVFSTKVLEEDKLARKDVRPLPLVTIDGADARDFDDAVYCEKTNSGWRLLVAIADVAHYVQPGAPLDKEAIKRGTSVYFPGRVVPMLPEVLSNGLCSLNPEVDRLCMLCEMTLDENAAIKRTRFYNAVMRSHARLTYKQVSEMLTESTSPLRKQYEAVLPHVEALHKLYKVLATSRRKRGVIEFESNETQIIFDDNKKIKEIIPVVRNDAHKLIEECMILANVAAAAYLEQNKIPTLYRVHATPKAEKLEDLRAYLALRGLQLGGGDAPTTMDYAEIMSAIQGRPDQATISTVMLRSMQQAVYQPRNEGHFGLALAQYAHFTSPIRRYPDLLVHRAIKHVLSRNPIEGNFYTTTAMAVLGESCSTTERRAEDASRDVVSWLKCEYMQDHIGEEFDGIVSAVTSFGLFIDLPSMHIEGLVHITSLPKDYYRYEQASLTMTGEKTGRKYQLGDKIRIRVMAVNLEDRKIDFAAADAEVRASSGKDKYKGKKRKDRKGKGKHKKDDKKSGNQQQSEKRDDTHDDKPSGKGHVWKKPLEDKTTDLKGTEGKGPEDKSKPISAEKKRQMKRKQKQQKRDKKRAEAKRKKRQDMHHSSTKAESAEISHAAKRLDAKKSGKSRAVKQNDSASKQAADKHAVAKKAEKATTKKTTAKKTTAKKTTAKKTTAKKATAKKATAKKATAKKTTAKKATAKKATAKKTTAKKTTAKKTTAKKTTAKKKPSGNKSYSKKKRKG
ncbi:MAG: ribonuclease R [Granulosicoccaceae bacterium]